MLLDTSYFANKTKNKIEQSMSIFLIVIVERKFNLQKIFSCKRLKWTLFELECLVSWAKTKINTSLVPLFFAFLSFWGQIIQFCNSNLTLCLSHNFFFLQPILIQPFYWIYFQGFFNSFCSFKQRNDDMR